MQENLFVNGSFEVWSNLNAPPNGWLMFKAQGNPVLSQDPAVSKEGGSSARIEALDGIARASVNQRINNIKPSSTYTLSYWVKTDNVQSAGQGTALRLQYFTEQGSKIGGNDMPDRTLKGTNDWTKITYSFRTPAGTENVLIDFFLWEATGTVWFDHAELVQEKPWVNPSVFETYNASFDMINDANQMPKGWSKAVASGTPLIEADEAVKKHGTASIKLQADQPARANVNRMISIGPDTMYYLTYWMKTEDVASSESKGGATMRFQIRDAGNAKIGNNYHVNFIKGTTGWTQYTYAFYAPENARSILIEPFLWEGTGTVWYDDLRLEKAGAMVNLLDNQHPRLWAGNADFAALYTSLLPGTTKARLYEEVKVQADNILTEPLSEHVLPDGTRLLATSRKVLSRLYTLGMVYQMEKQSDPAAAAVYAERAWDEIEAVAAFPDWNPNHFLDTAEMTHAFAIGYDWFYDYWSEAQRETIREAIVNHGLNEGLQQYQNGWWHNAVSNWNFVCNAGLLSGALAIGDDPEYREIADAVIRNALVTIEKAFEQFNPNGGWYEGPGYWDYATQYLTVFLGSLQSAIGTDFGYSDKPGVKDTGYFPIYFESPIGQTFNFSDAGSTAPVSPQLLWMSRMFDRPAYQWFRKAIAASPQSLLWYDESNQYAGPRADGLPLDRYFEYVETVSMRSAWEDRDAIFLGIKGAVEDISHKQLDAGEFVLDALGVRWAMLLGHDDYNIPGYFDDKGPRWTYYRNRSEGSNTIVINPSSAGEQDIHAAADIKRFETSPSEVFAIVDLTDVMGGEVTRAERGLKLLQDRRAVILQDEVETAKQSDIWWFMHTQTEIDSISPDGKTAVLQHNGQRLWAKILSPQGEFIAMDAKPLPTSPDPAGQNANQGIKKLAIHEQGATSLQWSVLMVPLRAWEQEPTVLPDVENLADWKAPMEEPAYLSGITLNGQPLSNFDAGTFTYNIDSPEDGQLPVVAATAVNGAVVHIDQVQEGPGSVWITVTDETRNVVTKYVLHFRNKAHVAESLPVIAVTSSGDDGNVAENTLDGDYNTRWSSDGNGEWIQYDLGSIKDVRTVSAAWYNGNARKANFTITVSKDGIAWEEVYSGQSSGRTTLLEHYDIGAQQARYVRITGYGNSANTFNSITEVGIYSTLVEPDLPPITLDRIELQANGLTADGILHLEQSVTLAVYGYNTDDTPADLSSAAIAYESSDPAIASVDANGVVTAHEEGAVKITVFFQQNRFLKTGYIELTVADAKRRFPTNDAYVKGGTTSNRNYGKELIIVKAATNEDFARIGYLSFDVSSIPQEAEQVLLYVYGNTQDNNGTDVDVSAHAVADDGWDELTITYSNRPAVGEELDRVHFDESYGWRTFDVTDFVLQEAAGDGIATIALQQNIPNGLLVKLNSNESVVNRPSLFYTIAATK
ncbi:DNRLRE domain-containing protein [Paenibacillus sp. GCM10027626]|uniref:CBM96 family carbohydrate-binding protein n=1 Tax=Paenibacillus sp. GCM10027626 TaxID=3273411 RepID=UPI00362F4C6E